MIKFADFISIDNDNDSNTSYLMDLEYGRMYKLNTTAYRLLTCIKSTGSYENYKNEIAKETNTDVSVLEKDIRSYLSSLFEKGYLLEI